MAKMDMAKYKILRAGRFLNPEEMLIRYNRKQGRVSRKYKARHIQ